MTASPSAHSPLPHGNAADGLANLLAGLGLLNSGTRSQIEDLIASELTSRGLNGEVSGVRYGVATITTNPHDAVLVRLDVDLIKDAVNATLPQPLDDIKVTTRARRPVHTPVEASRSGG